MHGLRFAPCRGLAALIAAPVLAWAQNPPAPAPAPADGVVHLAPYEMIEPKAPETLHQKLQALDHVFDGPFPELRSGPLIEAILWRHKYLAEHPGDHALILTTQTGIQVKSATTIYSENGRVYGSSNAMGPHRLFKGIVPADLENPKKVELIRSLIQRERDAYLPGAQDTRADLAYAADPTGGDNADLAGGPPTLGKLLILAEETGDYSVLARQAGSGAKSQSLQMAMVQTYLQPQAEVLDWTYRAMHDPARVGLIPVALARIEFKKPDGKPDGYQAVVFDWDGNHYIYNPDRGTQAVPLPRNPVTGLPYLVARGGGMLECAYFCVTYLAAHPGEKAVLLPGTPAAVAFTEKGSVGIFGLALGPFRSKPMDGAGVARVLASPASLVRLRDRLAAQTRQPLPADMPGDTADLQMRRAFLALQAAGISSHLVSGAEPKLTFTWAGGSFVYGPDQVLRPASGG